MLLARTLAGLFLTRTPINIEEAAGKSHISGDEVFEPPPTMAMPWRPLKAKLFRMRVSAAVVENDAGKGLSAFVGIAVPPDFITDHGHVRCSPQPDAFSENSLHDVIRNDMIGASCEDPGPGGSVVLHQGETDDFDTVRRRRPSDHVVEGACPRYTSGIDDNVSVLGRMETDSVLSA